MKRGFRYGLIGVAALAALAFAAPFLLPADIYKASIEQRISQATGRTFVIKGPLRFAFFPAFAIEAHQVSLANVSSGHAPFMASADDIRLGVRLWPLLSGKIEITQIVFDRPSINLEVDRFGRANWITNGEKTSSGKAAGNSPAMTTRLSGLSIAHGTVQYVNFRTNSLHLFEDINAAIDVTGLEQPLAAKGTLLWGGHRVTFHVKASDPKALLNDRATNAEIDFRSDILQTNFNGVIAPDGSVNGDIRLDTTAMRSAAEWIGARLPDSGGFNALSVAGHIAGDNRDIELSYLTLFLDGMTAKGDLGVRTEGRTPSFKGSLEIDHLDLNPYLTRQHPVGAPRVRRDDEGWSDKPISLDILKKANADLTLDVGKFAVRKLRLGRTHIAVSLKDAKLDARLGPAGLYNGSGNAELQINAQNIVPTFHTKLEFNNIALQPFLFDTMGVQQIGGTGTIRLDIASKGDSADAIMHGLGGKGSIAFRNGQLHGVDLGAVGRTIQNVLGMTVHPDDFTAYSTMDGSFGLVNGVLTNTDFRLAGPMLNATGSGSVDLGNRAIDFKIVPQATAVIDKQRLSIGVPFHIKGPWKHVHYAPDLTGIVKGVIGNLESGKAPFKGLFGPSKPADPNAPKKKHKNIGDALKNILGIH